VEGPLKPIFGLAENMKKQGVLFFDLDGTLADSGAGIHAALNDVFTTRGYDAITETELYFMVGPPLQDSLPVVFAPRGISEDLVETFIYEYRATYIANHLPSTQFNAGMAEALESLSKHWHLAVVTSKPQPQAIVAVRALGVEHMFVTVVGPDSDGSYPKSLLLERALREVEKAIGEQPIAAQCWMIGDRHHDIDAGVAMGTKSMGVMWGFGTHEELTHAGAHVIAESPAHLVSTLLAHL
jgi:phosphoglycolate phosphatase